MCLIGRLLTSTLRIWVQNESIREPAEAVGDKVNSHWSDDSHQLKCKHDEIQGWH
jgi:hypothetical protein